MEGPHAWQELQPAISPGPDHVDADGCWTGSVIARGGGYYLFYTGHRAGAPNPQTICLATSEDLISFSKDPRNPLLLPPRSCEPNDWRDPYVFFNEDEGRYWMIIAARLAEGPRWTRGALMLATSADLVDWQMEADPLYVPGDTYCPECPELWTLNGLWYLVYSRFSERAGTIYRVADSPRGPFRVPQDDELGGRRWYAAKSAPSADEQRRLFFGWVHDQAPSGRWEWGGDFAVPREVFPDAAGELLVQPVGNLCPDHAELSVHEDAEVRGLGGASSRCLTATDGSLAFHAMVTLVPEDRPASFGLTLDADSDGGGWSIAFDRIRRTIRLSRTPAPLDDLWAELVGRGEERREVDGPIAAEARWPGAESEASIRCELIVQDDLVEVYVEGAKPLTHRLGGIERGLGLFVIDGAITARIDAHPLS